MNSSRRRILEFTFLPQDLNDVALLECLLEHLQQTGQAAELDTTQFGSIGGKHFLTEVRTVGRWEHGFKTPGLDVVNGFNRIAGLNRYLLHIEEKALNAMEPSALVARLLRNASFYSARLADSEFEFWQNADQLCLYERRGRSYEGKPLVSNGLPFPLEETVVDISHNPGRRIFREGFIEAVGYKMWLSAQFIRTIGSPAPQSLVSAGWKVAALPNDGVSLEVEPSIFSEDGPPELQAALRDALYSAGGRR